MRKIELFQSQQITDLINSQELAIAEYALEKDFFVTKVLKVLAGINNENFDLIFCGGTCLSKAYGYLDRISEDVDIKVVAKPDKAFGKGKARALLSQLKVQTSQALVNAGFPEENVSVEAAMDGNAYVLIHIAYETFFEQGNDMRSQVKLELNYTELLQPKVKKSIGLLFDGMAGILTSPRFDVECVGPAQAFVEKLVSFPRRLALHIAHPERIFEPAMVRHLYDVYQILHADQTLVEQLVLLRRLMLTAMGKDAGDFASQHPEFLVDPVGELNRAMAMAGADSEIRASYDRFIKVMVYGATPPDFDKALSLFKRILELVMPPSNTNFMEVGQDRQDETDQFP
ncbi:nucleotidyl transferase AbiEii/AbiGii toxin family protein [Glaciimonas sp. GG7]